MNTYIVTYRDPQNKEIEEKIEGCSAGNAFAKCLKLHPDATLVKAFREGYADNKRAYGYTEWTPPPVQRAPVKEPRATRPPKPNEKVCEFSFYDEAKSIKP